MADSSSSVPSEFNLALSYLVLMKDDYYKIFNDDRDCNQTSSSSSSDSVSSNTNDNNVIKKENENVGSPNVKTDSVNTNNVDLNISYEETPKKGPFLCGSGNAKEKPVDSSISATVMKNCIIS